MTTKKSYNEAQIDIFQKTFDHNDQDTEMMETATDSSIKLETTDSDGESGNWDNLLCYNPSTDNSDFNRCDSLPFNTNHGAPVYEESSADEFTEYAGDDSEDSDCRYPKQSEVTYGENRCSRHQEKPNFFIRNQPRRNPNENFTELKACLQTLLLTRSLPAISHPRTKLWFHATSWKAALGIIRSHPRFEEKAQDLAAHGAFYLNPDFDDSYEWFFHKRGSFEGKHAMLVFIFDPWELDKNGEELDVARWKQLVHSRNSKKCKLAWSLAPQNKHPDRIDRRDEQPQFNRTARGDISMQLVVRSRPMCRQLSDFLVKCIFFEKLNHSSGTVMIGKKNDESNFSHKYNKRGLKKSRGK